MIPKAALEMKLPAPDELTLDDLELLFEPGGIKSSRFKEFMKEHSNWSVAEVGKLTRKEATEIYDQIKTDYLDKLIPKESAAPS